MHLPPFIGGKIEDEQKIAMGIDGRGFAFSTCRSGFRRTVPSMCKLMMILAVAALLAGCTGEIGEVDHSCHVNPYDSQGSGCEHHHLRGVRPLGRSD
jgi:hypothetical protein